MIKEYIKINIASPSKILSWTERLLPNNKLVGEITKAETINYETFKPVNDGLFCEKIFGPIKDWECNCKRYKKIQIKNNDKIIICPKCYVEITETKIRNYRMGIKLSTPVTHIWYLKSIPNYITKILINKSSEETNKISSFKSYIMIKENNENKRWITGGEALNILLKEIKLEQRCDRLKLINHFLQTKSNPHWMIIYNLPVLPPNLRPIVKLQDKTLITTDLNFLYAKIININSKINKLRKMLVPEPFLINEKFTLQIQGKRGRFRENLLGKTVDYSGRSVIIVEPNLKLNECGIPEEMHAILLNRAPTLHRVIGIQAFQPKLISCKSIKLHPLVCSAFNADFDGDQMGVHIPLSLKTQAEARLIMISANNCTSPATGLPNILPSQDMILGCYYLTVENTRLYYLLQQI
uniref:RNA polymerase subunit beta' n=1 Tax=Strombomonas costata TaxID=161230 RepID=UPI0023AB3CE3|nr:RNA polymerase subunit beta' [Strombomonas costata]WCH63630.1 RNA polymerase subunit beta' [Strombomonas costata]